MTNSALRRDRWVLSCWLGLIISFGFTAVAVLTYNKVLSAARRAVVQQILPLTLDALSADVQEDFIRPMLFARAMAANSLLLDWQDAGEQPGEAITRYLASIQREHHATTTFFVSERTLRYYHPRGVIKTLSPDSPQDAWYFRLRNGSRPYELNLDRDTADLNRQTLFVNVKLRDGQGRFRGAVGLGQSSRLLTNLIRKAQRDHAIQVLFVDRQGQILFSDQPEATSPRTLAGMPGIGPFAGRILSSPSTAISFRSGGQEIVARSQLIPDLDWFLVVRSTVRLPADFVRDSALQLALAALVTLLLALWLAFEVTGRHHRKLEALACTDPLSGALNRTAFPALFGRLREESRRTGQPMALALLDIDHFKAINDQQGHLAGDAVIRRVCDRIRACLRPQDLLFRWGGEEFLLLLPMADAITAMELVEGLRQAIAASHQGLSPEPMGATISAGVSVLDDLEQLDALLDRADQALYSAKQQGRNRVVRN